MNNKKYDLDNQEYILEDGTTLSPKKVVEILNSLTEKISSLKKELIEEKLEWFFDLTSLGDSKSRHPGWHCSDARSDAVYLGDQLVDFGILEKHTDGCGRVWRYRLITKD